MLVFFVVFAFIAYVGSWLVGIKLNNSNIFYFGQRTLIHKLSFHSESVKDITSYLPDIFPPRFIDTSIELQSGVRSKQFSETFFTSQASFRAITPSQYETQIYEFFGFKKGKKFTS